MVTGFVALLVVGFVRDGGVELSEGSNHERKVTMKKANESFRVVVFGILNSIWAIGASIMAVPLSA